jgi:hypothetical protein
LPQKSSGCDSVIPGSCSMTATRSAPSCRGFSTASCRT